PLKSCRVSVQCLDSCFKGPYQPFCMFEPNIFNFHTYNLPKACYWNGELKMFFLPSRPPLVSVHSGTLLKSTC
ncbi:hypothetical protein LDENG_00202450, partial [Lucifuga dentata]